PLIAPGIAAGAFLAFIASLDDVPVSMFLSSAQLILQPIRMSGMIEATVDARCGRIRLPDCIHLCRAIHDGTGDRHDPTSWSDLQGSVTQQPSARGAGAMVALLTVEPASS